MIEAGTFLQQRYRIDKQIGQGGMGAVYVATDERFNSIVAIKETLCMDDNFRKAIEREARLLNSLKHSALPRVSDHFLEDEGQFLVMEYIQGADLQESLEKQNKPFPVETVLVWAEQLLDAVDYLHNQNDPVIHRDIKPQNLKITSHGQIILLDFGLAKGNPTDAGNNTAAKSIFGFSRNYASLEQIQGTGTDPRSDLYSLAATLYHLMTNSPPEDALTRAMSVLSKKGDPLRPANAINPSIPAGVAGVLQKALDLNTGERPANAAEMKEMLRNSEVHAHLADPALIYGGATAPQIHGQATKLMFDATRPGAMLDTDVKTRVMPEPDSPDTSGTAVGRAGDTGGSRSAARPKGRSFTAAAGAFLVLVVGSVIAGGFYFVDSGGFGVPSSELDSLSDVAPVQDAIMDPAQTVTSDPTEEANTAVDNAQPTENAPRSAESKRAAKTTGTTAGKTDEGDVTEFNVDDPDIPDGGIVVTERDKNGKLKTMRVNRVPRPPNVQTDPNHEFDAFPPGVDPSTMSPAQLQKLKDAWKKRVRPPFSPQP